MKRNKMFLKGKAHIYYTMLISFMSVLLNCFINLYLTPKITNSVGVEAYGFVSLSKNFVSYANIIMTALNSYAARYMSVAYMQGKYDEYKKYCNTVFFADMILGGLIFLVGIICTFNVTTLLNVPEQLVVDVKLLFLLTFATFFITTISTVFFATGYVKDRLDLVNSIKSLSFIMEIICLGFMFFLLNPKISYVGLATLIAALVVLVGTVVITKRLLPENRLSFKYFDKFSLKKLVISGFWNSANSMGNALNSGLDLLVSNIYLSALAMGQMSVAKTIGNLLYTLYATISQPFQPTFLKKYSEGDLEGLIHELKYSMKVCGIVTNLVFAGFFVLGMEFYKLWIATQDITLIYKLTIIAMLPCITEGCVFPIYYIYTLTVKNRFPCIVTIIGGVLNVVGMLVLLNITRMGVFAIVITTAVVMNFINLVTNPLYMAHCLGVRKSTFYPNIFLNIICCVIAMLSMRGILLIFPETNGWIGFLIKVAACSLVGLVTQFVVVFKPTEINRMISKIKRS